MTSRRDFLRQGGVAVGAVALAGAVRPAEAAVPLVGGSSLPATMDAPVKDLLMEALDAARLAGAQYADARIGRYLQNFVVTREQQIINVVDTDSIGIGVRALVDGTWGFAATRDLTKAGVAAAAREAVAIAKANRVARDRAVQLAPAPAVPDATWKSAYEIDPWSVPVEEKARPAPQGQRRGDEGGQREVRVQRALLPEDGAELRQHRRLGHRADGGPERRPAAVHGRRRRTISDFQNRGNTPPPVGRG